MNHPSTLGSHSRLQMQFGFSESPARSKPRAVELFAGVGGFRLGIEEWWDVAWSNQWEPSTKAQHASECYVRNFGNSGHVCEPIEEVLRRVRDEEEHIPDHDLLTAGFPCQDYSVARVLSQADGLSGKKGILWWSIHEVLYLKRPRFVLLENVDRLLKSPATQRGRDFAVILWSLAQLGYRAEWRVINAADYGFPQRRRRVFIVGERMPAPLGDPRKWMLDSGILARAFPVVADPRQSNSGNQFAGFGLDESLEIISDNFGAGMNASPFNNAGVMQDYQMHTMKVKSDFRGPLGTLRDVLQDNDQVAEYFFVTDSLDTWSYLKGSKKEVRKHRGSDTPYSYGEGAISFPDQLDKPSRTIVTGESGSSPSRFKHVIRTSDGRLRRLTPIELERLNGFPTDWTKGLSDNKRGFLMGNALVVGVVARIAKVLSSEFRQERFFTPMDKVASGMSVGTDNP